MRDRWRTRVDRPYLRAAGTWIEKGQVLPVGISIRVGDPDALEAAARRQLDDGADMVKLYMDGAKAEESPWSASDVRRVTDMAHARGAVVTAHSTLVPGAHAAIDGGVDSLEHGFGLDADAARKMAERGIFLVTTLAVFRSLATFVRASPNSPVASEKAREGMFVRRRSALASTRLAHAAGVPIAAGTDFGGGSLRAVQLAWEVEALVEAGLEPWEALGAATYRGGELLREPDAGTLREGGPADFLLVHGDPLTDPASLWRVWRVAWEPEAVGTIRRVFRNRPDGQVQDRWIPGWSGRALKGSVVPESEPPEALGTPSDTWPARSRRDRSKTGEGTVREVTPKLTSEVDAYIARCPAKVRGKLVRVRNAIRAAAPDATEVISYQIPGYSYPGHEYQGMFAWFGLQSNHIGPYVRPPTIENHRRELAGYKTTKSAVHLPLDREIPIRLIQTLVRASVRVMKERGR